MVIRYYVAATGQSPFARWFDGVDRAAAEKIRTAIARLEQGNLSSVTGVGAGVFEARLHFGPGYRVYFGKDGDRIIILLGGGTKARQSRDIADAIARWHDYKRRK